LKATAASVDPNVVHIHSEPWGILVLQVLLGRALSRGRFRVCVHSADRIYHHGSRLEKLVRKAILRFVLPRIDGFVSINPTGIRVARGAGLPSSVPTEVVLGWLPDPSRFLPASSEARLRERDLLDLPRNEVIVGLIARLVPEKGIDDAIGALRLLGGDAPFLAVWGAGPLEARLHDVLGRGEIRGLFGGFLSLADVPRALRACDIVLIPSRSTETSSEQFGRIAIEAQLSGSAVIAYRSGELPFVVGEGGLLVEEGNEQELARAIHKLSTNDELRTRLARVGQEQALRRFRPAVQAHRLIALWTKMASG